MRYETVYIGRDNTFSRALYSDSEVLTDEQMDAIQNVTLSIGTIDVETLMAERETGAIRWRFEDARPGELRFHLGDLSSLDEMSGLRRGRITVYDSENTDGIVWGFIPIYFVQEV